MRVVQILPQVMIILTNTLAFTPSPYQSDHVKDCHASVIKFNANNSCSVTTQLYNTITMHTDRTFKQLEHQTISLVAYKTIY